MELMQLRRWWPAGVALLALAASACASSSAKELSTTSSSPMNEIPVVGDSPTSTNAASTTAAPTTTTTIVKVPIARTLVYGSRGDDVKMVQQRLKDMHFDPGTVNGVFTLTTEQAVWAFQHLHGAVGKQADGKVTPALWSTMQDPLNLAPQKPGNNNHLEVYLPIQVAVLFTNNQVTLITHISSGNNQHYCADGTCSKAVTPGGVYTFGRRFSGWHTSDLGTLYNPVYFNFGIAVHGEESVPNYPASHGCVRIPMTIAQYFPTLVHTGDVVYVFDGVKDPSVYGAQPPPWNTKDPNATTTTVKPTTTTVKPTTTTVKAVTTTTAPHPTTTAPHATTTTRTPSTTKP
jgi:hypothetical protein